MVKTFSRTRRAGWAIAGSMLDTLVGLIAAFLITPLILVYLGDTVYGSWIVVMQLVTYMAILDIRPMSVLKLTLAKEQNSDDTINKCRQVGAAMTIGFMMMPVYLTIGTLFVYYIPELLHVPPDSIESVRWASSILVFAYAAANITALPMVVLEGTNSAYRVFGLNAFIAVLISLADYGAIRLDLGLEIIALNKLLGQLLKSFIAFFIMKKGVPWFAVNRPHRSDLSRFFKLSGWMLVLSVAYIVGNYSQMGLVGIFLGPAVVTVYSLTSSIMNRTKGPLQQILSVLRPGTGDLYGRKAYEDLIRVRKEIINFTNGCLFVVGAVVILNNESFISLWVGERYFAGSNINFLVVLLVFFTLHNGVDSNLLESMLAMRARSVIGLISMLVSLVSAILLLKTSLGLEGFVLGLLAGPLLELICFPWVMAPLLFTSVRKLYTDLFYPLLLTVPVLYLLSVFAAEWTVWKSWSAFLVGGMASGLVASLWVWLVQFGTKDRAMVHRRLKILFKN